MVSVKSISDSEYTLTHGGEEESHLVHTQGTAGSNPARAIVTINFQNYIKKHWLDRIILPVLFIAKKSR